MEKFRVAVETTSDPKIKYLREVLDGLKVMAKLVSVDVKSGVSEQPITSEETKQGSTNRAKGAFEMEKDADFAKPEPFSLVSNRRN